MARASANVAGLSLVRIPGLIAFMVETQLDEAAELDAVERFARRDSFAAAVTRAPEPGKESAALRVGAGRPPSRSFSMVLSILGLGHGPLAAPVLTTGQFEPRTPSSGTGAVS